MKKIFTLITLLLILTALLFNCKRNDEIINVPPYIHVDTLTYDVVIYGSTPSGISAAIQAAKMGKNIILISNSNKVGGMCTAGLCNTDIGNPATIGGICLEFYKDIAKNYGINNRPVWRFEPKVANKIFENYISKYKIKILRNEYINLKKGVEISNSSIKEIILESGKKVKGKIFIDASYEGDLMALSKVNYTIGRESSLTYNEDLNGAYKNFETWLVDPYIKEGVPASGLLPQIASININNINKGQADNKIQAFNFRLCLTNKNNNKKIIEKPDNYDEVSYELLIRTLKKQPNYLFWSLYPTVNDKFDGNNNSFPSLDYVGMNYDFFKSDYPTRNKIKIQHLNYIKGLIWTLQNNTRIPLEVRKKYQPYGLALDEFTDNDHWPTDIYIREGRRLIGEYVMTQKDIMSSSIINNSIGLGSYEIDCHGVQFLVGSNKKLHQEGSIFVKVPKPYGISYNSIVPKESECNNLLVPVCMSASHVAYCSIRMEPQYMILGQAAGAAAALAVEYNTSVQKVSYVLLKQRLLLDKQVISI